MQRRPILFLDIPMTGGTRLLAALGEHAEPRLTFGRESQLSATPDEELARYQLISGHFHAFQMEHPVFASFLKVTALRDPLERFIGLYEFARKQGFQNQGCARQRFAAQVPMLEYFMSPAGVAHRHAQLYTLGLDPGEEAWSVPLEVLLSRARHRLGTMVVAIEPRIAEVATRLRRLSGLGITADGPPQDFDISSRAAAASGVDPDDMQMMRDVLSVDMALHTLAAERCAAFIADLRVPQTAMANAASHEVASATAVVGQHA